MFSSTSTYISYIQSKTKKKNSESGCIFVGLDLSRVFGDMPDAFGEIGFTRVVALPCLIHLSGANPLGNNGGSIQLASSKLSRWFVSPGKTGRIPESIVNVAPCSMFLQD